MAQFIINILTPILVPMGVSAADVESYVNLCSNYILALVISLVVLIVLLIAAHWMAKKGSRHVVRWTALLAWIACVGIIANQVVFGPLKTNLAQQFAPKVELNEETVEGSKDIIRITGEQGMVLLKNEGLLPLSSDVNAINVFGWDSINPVLGGTGSGSSDGSSAVGVLQSLQDAGYATNEKLTQIYKDYTEIRPTIAMASQDWTLPEPTMDKYTDDIISDAKNFSGVAMIVIGRSGGEGADLPTDMNAVINGTYDKRKELAVKDARDRYNYTNATYTNNGDYDDFEPGEHYLELSVTEEKLVDLVCSNFENVIVVVNANNAMELGWVDEHEQIKAVIFAPGPGTTGFTALGEILNGSVNPSGKTVDTFVKDLTKTPTFNNFGQFGYSNTKDLQKDIAAADSAYEGAIGFVDYVENIYVGYKFYETAAEEGLITYEDEVQYPFGYGLSYTTFTQEITSLEKLDDMIKVEVSVTNTGDVAGRDVVELYMTPPYTNGGIEKASVNLVDFEKTALLDPDATQTFTFEVPFEDIASYDSACIKTENGGYILEAGDYKFSVRSDSHTVLDEETFTIDADIDYSKDGRSSDLVVANNLFDFAEGPATYLSRKDGFANYAEATAAPTEERMVLDDESLAIITETSSAGYDPTAYQDASLAMPTLEAQNGLTLADLAGAPYDDERWEQLLDQFVADEMVNVINRGGWGTQEAPSVGKVATSDCDGPAGLSNFVTGNYGTAFSVEVLMAQTWSKEIAMQMGDMMGQEYEDANNLGWYGPAMNTHRNAFAGRNFEYYSEDGVLAGKFALEEIKGAAKHGVYAYIKHFCLNDQEMGRCSFLMTYSTEQAIREIYAKPFEIVVKGFDFEKGPLAVMSSFNFIGAVPSCEDPALLIDLLRNEWGFKGMVITDYNGSYGYMHTDAAIRNGNDLMLGFGMAATNALDTTSPSVIANMKHACKNIMYTISNSGYYRTSGYSDAEVGPVVLQDTNAGLTAMTNLFNKINMIGGIVLAAIWLIVLIRWLGKKKKAAEA